MTTLLLVSLFVSFFLALLSLPIDILAMYIPTVAVNASFSISLSIVGNALIGFPIKEFIIRVFATAFVSRVLLAVAEKVTDYRPAVINSSRQ